MSIVHGTVIGQYRVLSLLGEGGMGTVYHGEHVVLGRQVALKVLLQHVARHPTLVQRFINEGRVASQMNHRNVVDVLDCGMFPSPDAPDAQWYIAMEYLRGKSLARFIGEHGGKPIDISTIVHVLGEAANGLHAAHERHQLVHRDVKPDNLYVTQADDDPLRIKVLDFGIAKLRQQMNGVQTQSQTAMGTPAYAAPEQLRESKDVDARADVWALGVIAHEMITGVRPWGATTSVWEIISHHTALKEAPDPRAFRPDTPPKIAAVISKAMEPDPNRRWKSVKAFACALADAATMPYSVNGLAILDKYAPELTRASNLSMTLGRPMPAEIQVRPAEIVTARERPIEGRSSTRAHMDAEHVRPISTINASSGESVAPASTRRSRGGVLAFGVLLAVAAIVAVILVTNRSETNEASSSQPSVTMHAAVDAAVRPDAPPSKSTLAIVTNPHGAKIFVDNVSKGLAPLDVELPIGTRVELRAETSGHAVATRMITIEPKAATVKLDLAPLVDGAAAVTPPPSKSKRPIKRDSGKRAPSTQPRRDDEGTRPGSGSNQSFNPNDVL